MSKNTNLSFLTDYITADITNGRIGINNASPSYAFDVTGTARTSTSTYLATASGNVGIGTTTPLDTYAGRTVLTINNNGAYGAFLNFGYNGTLYGSIEQGTAELKIANYQNIPTIFYTNSAERMRITSGGNIIQYVNDGTFSIYKTDGTTLKAQIGNPDGSTTDEGALYLYKTNVLKVQLRANGTSYLNGGNVGIGTTSPINYTNQTSLTINGVGVSRLDLFVSGTRKGGLVSAGDATYVEADTAIPLIFNTNGSERMRILSGGSVLIGMSSAVSFRSDSQLQVNNCTILRSNDGYNGNPSAVIYSGNDQSGTMFVEFTSSGFSRIGSITRNGASNVSYNTGSDIRIKKNIIDAPTSLEKLNSIQVRSFDWVEDDAHQDFGFIAQELINVMPVAVTRGAKEKDIWQVDNSKLVPLLVKSIQELKAEIDTLKNK